MKYLLARNIVLFIGGTVAISTCSFAKIQKQSDYSGENVVFQAQNAAIKMFLERNKVRYLISNSLIQRTIYNTIFNHKIVFYRVKLIISTHTIFN